MKIIKEIKGIVKGINFIIFCLPCVIISIIHAVLAIKEYLQYSADVSSYMTESNVIYNPHWAIYSIYQLWIGNDLYNNLSTIMLYVFPIEIAIFCLMSCNSKNEKYKSFKAQKFVLYDYIVTFITSGIIAAVPLLLNFILLLLYVPVVLPDSVYNSYYSFFAKNFLANVYYSFPNLYIFIFLLLNFVLFGMIGCISVSIYKRVGKCKISMLLPEAFLIILEFTKNIWNKFVFKSVEISPLSYLLPVKSYNTNWIVIIVELFICILIILLLVKVRKNEFKEN